MFELTSALFSPSQQARGCNSLGHSWSLWSLLLLACSHHLLWHFDGASHHFFLHGHAGRILRDSKYHPYQACQFAFVIVWLSHQSRVLVSIVQGLHKQCSFGWERNISNSTKTSKRPQPATTDWGSKSLMNGLMPSDAWGSAYEGTGLLKEVSQDCYLCQGPSTSLQEGFGLKTGSAMHFPKQ